VSEEIVVRVVGCLGNGVHRPGAGVQAGLLRWLVMVYNVLEDYEMLSRLYGVLFNLLDMMTLRYGCYLSGYDSHHEANSFSFLEAMFAIYYHS
jgi:hypothetical protein